MYTQSVWGSNGTFALSTLVKCMKCDKLSHYTSKTTLREIVTFPKRNNIVLEGTIGRAFTLSGVEAFYFRNCVEGTCLICIPRWKCLY
ncbi:hypothetical protein CR513_50642, partial [Mucuna pruriens]